MMGLPPPARHATRKWKVDGVAKDLHGCWLILVNPLLQLKNPPFICCLSAKAKCGSRPPPGFSFWICTIVSTTSLLKQLGACPTASALQETRSICPSIHFTCIDICMCILYIYIHILCIYRIICIYINYVYVCIYIYR